MQHMPPVRGNQLDYRHHANLIVCLNAILAAATLASQPMHVFREGGHGKLGDFSQFRTSDDLRREKDVELLGGGTDVVHFASLFKRQTLFGTISFIKTTQRLVFCKALSRYVYFKALRNKNVSVSQDDNAKRFSH